MNPVRTMMPLFVRTLVHIFTSRSSPFLSSSFFLALPTNMPLLSCKQQAAPITACIVPHEQGSQHFKQIKFLDISPMNFQNSRITISIYFPFETIFPIADNSSRSEHRETKDTN